MTIPMNKNTDCKYCKYSTSTRSCKTPFTCGVERHSFAVPYEGKKRFFEHCNKFEKTDIPHPEESPPSPDPQQKVESKTPMQYTLQDSYGRKLKIDISEEHLEQKARILKLESKVDSLKNDGDIMTVLHNKITDLHRRLLSLERYNRLVENRLGIDGPTEAK